MKLFLHFFTPLFVGMFFSFSVHAAPIKIAYATSNMQLDPSATNTVNDPIIQMLKQDANFSITILTGTGEDSYDLSGYDLVIIQESFASASPVFKQESSFGLANISIPFIYNKVFALREHRALNEAPEAIAQQDIGIKYLEVKPVNQSNELFKNITFQNNRFDVFHNLTTHTGETNGEIGIQYASGVPISTPNTLLAYGSFEETSVCLNDMPAGTKIGSETTKARMIAMGMQIGAICGNHGNNLTNEGLTLWRNAIYSLARLEIPNSIVFSNTKTDQLPPVEHFKATNHEFSVSLSWNYSYTNYIEHFEIWKGTSSDNLAYYAETSDLNFEDHNVQVGDEIYYQVLVKSQVNNAATIPVLVNVQELAPATPEFDFYEAQNKVNYLQWTMEPTLDLSYFRIYRGLSAESIEVFDSVSADKLSYVDSEVENFTKYYYYISAVDENKNESPFTQTLILEPHNMSPEIQHFDDFVAHDIEGTSVTMPFNLDKSKDLDGTLTSFYWYINNMEVSTAKNPILRFYQGTNEVKVVIEDNDGAKDSTTFTISVDGGYYTFKSNPTENAGISGISDNYIYVPTADGKMQILDGNLNELLNISVPGNIRSVSSISTDTIMYLSSSTKSMYCFNKLGIPKWSIPLGGDLLATPTIDVKRNRIYTGVSNNNIFGINRNTGAVDWLYKANGPVEQPGIILGADTLLVLAGSGEILLFDLDGVIENDQMQAISSFSIGTTFTSAPALDSNQNIYITAGDNSLKKIHFNTSTNGEILWSIPITTMPNVCPVIGEDGTIYIGSQTGAFYAINPLDGNIKWSVQLDGAISSTATINYFGRMYVGTESGTLYALEKNGLQAWKYVTGSPIANASFYENFNLYFSNATGELFKMHDPGIEISILGSKSAKLSEQPQWGTYLGNSRRSGMQLEALGIVLANKNFKQNTLKIDASPNPFSSSFQLSLSQELAGNVNINIYNMNGKLVKAINQPVLIAGKQSIEVSLENMPSGIYIYQVVSAENTTTGKIVKQ